MNEKYNKYYHIYQIGSSNNLNDATDIFNRLFNQIEYCSIRVEENIAQFFLHPTNVDNLKIISKYNNLGILPFGHTIANHIFTRNPNNNITPNVPTIPTRVYSTYTLGIWFNEETAQKYVLTSLTFLQKNIINDIEKILVMVTQAKLTNTKIDSTIKLEYDSHIITDPKFIKNICIYKYNKKTKDVLCYYNNNIFSMKLNKKSITTTFSFKIKIVLIYHTRRKKLYLLTAYPQL